MGNFGGVLDFGLGFIRFGGCFCCEKKKGRKRNREWTRMDANKNKRKEEEKTSADYADKRTASRH